MSIVLPLLAQVLHIGLLLVLAPTVAGAIDWIQARLQGRSGPPALMPWRDLLRWWRKTPMTLDAASVVTRTAPVVSLAATLSAATLVPSFTLGMTLAPLADVITIISLLAVSRSALALAALDAGGSAAGVVQQAASASAVLAEPSLMLAVIVLALMSGGFNLDTIIVQQRDGGLLPAAASTLAMTAMVALLFAESSQSRTDDPFGGAELALVRLADWLRPLIWVGLIGGLFLPVGMANADLGPAAWLIGLGFWGLKLGVFMIGLAVVRLLFGRVPPRRLPDLLGVAAVLALVAAIMVLASSVTA